MSACWRARLDHSLQTFSNHKPSRDSHGAVFRSVLHLLSDVAQRTHVAQLFVRETLLLVALGIIAGVPLAWVSSRLLGSLLYGVQSTEVQMLEASITILMVAGFLAVAAPLWRAVRIQPTEALRHE